MKKEYDQIVIGAGINGSWTAYHLAKQGQNVLLIDQVYVFRDDTVIH